MSYHSTVANSSAGYVDVNAASDGASWCTDFRMSPDLGEEQISVNALECHKRNFLAAEEKRAEVPHVNFCQESASAIANSDFSFLYEGEAPPTVSVATESENANEGKEHEHNGIYGTTVYTSLGDEAKVENSSVNLGKMGIEKDSAASPLSSFSSFSTAVTVTSLGTGSGECDTFKELLPYDGPPLQFSAVKPRIWHENTRSDILWDFSDRTIWPDEYTSDIYMNLRRIEKKRRIKPTFLVKQRELSAQRRAAVVNWLSDCHAMFGFKLDTLHLTVALLDRLLCFVKFRWAKAGLIGAATMMLASKVGEYCPARICELARFCISNSAKEIMSMEQCVFYRLGYCVEVPTAYTFSNFFNYATAADGEQIELVNYLLELALRVVDFYVFLPSEIAVTAIVAARRLLRRSVGDEWRSEIFRISGFTFDDLDRGVHMFFRLFEQASLLAPSLKREYSKQSHFCVANLRV